MIDDERPCRNFVLNFIKKGFVCAEIGVWTGNFAIKMMKRNPSKLHLIDPWEHMPRFNKRCFGRKSQDSMDRVYETALMRFEGEKRAIFHRKKSLEAVKEFPDRYFDFIYIDGNHDFAYIIADLIAYMPKVKDDGFIVGDDYGDSKCPWGGPRSAVSHIVKIGAAELLQASGNQYVLKVKNRNVNYIADLSTSIKKKKKVKMLLKVLSEGEVETND